MAKKRIIKKIENIDEGYAANLERSAEVTTNFGSGSGRVAAAGKSERREAVSDLDKAARNRVDAGQIDKAIDDYSFAISIIKETPEMFDNPQDMIRKYEENIMNMKNSNKGASIASVGKIAAIALFAGSAALLFPTITGNTVAGLAPSAAPWISGALFVAGLFVTFAFIRQN